MPVDITPSKSQVPIRECEVHYEYKYMWTDLANNYYQIPALQRRLGVEDTKVDILDLITILRPLTQPGKRLRGI
jgi:hypothetical protein